MGAVLSLDGLLGARRVWRGSPAQAPVPADALPTGCDALDAVLPSGGWPPSALSEILLPVDGVGELQLAWPVLARLSQAGRTVVLVAPPYEVHAPAWAAAGIDLAHLHLVHAETRDALWAAEQCLRSGACGAVLCWPAKADDRALRRLQVAAEAGQCIGLGFRPMQAALNPSPAALRVAIEPSTDGTPRQLRVLKCRGANAPTRPVPFPSARAA
ncbi:MAG TPA: translesion DNA synthesis-associated protein ImuA [Xanthomonadaceae bacterium]|nr:translesion DNA synthesis-associated protein ImuA [Xanthomonadaceae bacterium]